MANNLYTVFQRLGTFFNGGTVRTDFMKDSNVYQIKHNDVIDTAKSPEEYQMKKLQAKQQTLIAKQWKKATYDINNQTLSGLNEIKLMYRDSELMDGFPEIGTALDIFSEEACVTSEQGFMVNVNSKSDRIKSILNDLFVNRLSINIILPMICRAMCKYGNNYMLLNIDKDNGIMGWKQLPVYEMERYENGTAYPYVSAPSVSLNNVDETKTEDTKFVWVGQTEYIPYRSWQIAHFRLLYDSQFLPYGVSVLNKARRHFRMLSMMEDMMLIYRLDRSIERRIFKINVGAIDTEDVPAYVQEIANNFKRTPIIDPMTGQIDLRKNIMPVWKKTPIPLLDGRTITIEELAKEYKNGKTNYVYSIQDNTLQVVPGKVVWCGKNYTPNKMVKVTLDDDTYMVMAPEHEIVMRDGTKKRADKVVVGESVMPFYRIKDIHNEKKYKRYEQIYNPNSGKYEYTHRLIAREVEKGNINHNTVHHINFNKYDNTPTNLLWCDFNEHHKMHSQIAKNNWADPVKRENTIKKISESKKRYYEEHDMPIEVRQKISNSLKKTFSDPKYDELFKKLGNHISNYAKSEIGRENTRKHNIARASYKNMSWYNHSELHKMHDKIRSEKKKEFWKSKNAEEAVRKMTIVFDDFMWNEIRTAILNKIIYNRKTLLEYINTHLIDHLLEINTNKRLHKLHYISRSILQSRLNEQGFDTITEYINSIKKNHKIKSIEYIDGDDVYCMTVQGLNGEDDRHNFALQTFQQDGSWCNNGCFVSNCNTEDFFIPVRDSSEPSPIETLPAGQNLTAMDDIKFIQNKLFTALRVPKSFLNFEETTGDGKNLSLMDVRFTRTTNRIQQALLMELNKIAMIHLFLLGFTDEITDFTLTMNNPSSQAEMLELENLAKKITTAKDAVSDPGGGIPLTSMTWAWRHIMKWSDKEIQRNLEEIRLEFALAAELAKTSQIIKRTKLFDPVDNIYGESGAEYSEDNPNEEGGPDGGAHGGGGGMPIGGGDMDFGDEAPGDDMEQGAEGEMPMEDAANEDMGNMDANDPNGGAIPPMGESVSKKLKLLTEIKQEKYRQEMKNKSQHYMDILCERLLQKTIDKENESKQIPKVDFDNKILLINEEMTKTIEQLRKYETSEQD